MTRAAAVCLLAALLSQPVAAGDPPAVAPASESSYADRPLSWWIDQLDDREGAGVAQAVLRMMGADAAPAIVAALEGRGFDRSRSLLAAFEGLVRAVERTPTTPIAIEPALEGLGRLLDDADPRVRTFAQRLLRLAGRQSGAIAPSRYRLGSTDPSDRTEALYALRGAASVEAPVAQAIAGCLSDPVESVRIEAARTLLALGASASPATTSLLVARRSEDPEVRALVLQVLGHVRPVRDDVIGTLVAGVADDAVAVRPAAVRGLADLAKDSPAALDSLAALTAGPDPDVRRMAAEALKGLGPTAAPALPALGRALFDERSDVRAAAEDAIVSTGPAAKGAAADLVEAAGRGLGGSGTLYRIAPEAVLELAELLATVDEPRRQLILGALRRVPAARLAIAGRVLLEALAPALRDGSRPAHLAEVPVLLLARVAHEAPDLSPAVALALDAYLAAVARTDVPESQWANGVHTFGRATRGDPDLHPFLIDVVARHVADATIPSARRAAVVRYLHSSPFRDVAKVKALLESASQGSDPEVARMARETLDVILATEAALGK